MIRGIWNSLAGILPQMTHQEIAANNLANISTTGFKKDRPFLKSYLDAELVKQSDRDKYSRITDVEEIKTDFSQGLMEQTDNPLDLAILGNGFFNILTEQGVVYSRNGNFTIDRDSQLVNSDGNPVLGEGGPITISQGEIFIDEAGQISINGNVIDSIKISDFAQPYRLKKAANNVYLPQDDFVKSFDAEDFSIKHKFLERSNVIPVEEMLHMIVYFRNYEADTRILQAQDETLRRAVNDVGRPA